MFKHMSVLLIIFLLSSSCSNLSKKLLLENSSNKLNHELSANDPYDRKYTGFYRNEKKYKVKSVVYTPYKKVSKNHVEIGKASWYGHKEHNCTTANGDIFNKHSLTAAHKYLPIPCMIKVTNLHNQKQAIVLANDRGPFVQKRILDLSEAAAERLGFKNRGLANVKIEYLAEETDKLLQRLNLAKVHGSRTKNTAEIAPRCSVKCYLELINAKYDLVELTEKQKKLYQQSIVQNNI